MATDMSEESLMLQFNGCLNSSIIACIIWSYNGIIERIIGAIGREMPRTKEYVRPTTQSPLYILDLITLTMAYSHFPVFISTAHL